MLAFTIAKSSQMTKEEIQAGLKASPWMRPSTMNGWQRSM